MEPRKTEYIVLESGAMAARSGPLGEYLSEDGRDLFEYFGALKEDPLLDKLELNELNEVCQKRINGRIW